MIKSLFLIAILVILSGCAPSYMWVNNAYPADQMKDHLVVDKGVCLGDANTAYPEPLAIIDPYNNYSECRAYSRGYSGFYSGWAEDGRPVFGTVITGGSPYVCRPTFLERHNYKMYEDYVSQQRYNRADYVDSCLYLKGWEKINLDENTN